MNKEIIVSLEGNLTDNFFSQITPKSDKQLPAVRLPEILFITSYPPRECGIATYSQDLVKALNNKFCNSFSIRICALESQKVTGAYPPEVKYVFDTGDPARYMEIAKAINADNNIHNVVIQHEFGLFEHAGEDIFLQFLYRLSKPVVTVFHTILPNPDEALKTKVRYIVAACEAVVVMTDNAAKILKADYNLTDEKVQVIPHGTHLVPHLDKETLKEKYGLNGRKVLSTFGLLSSGKGIETTIDALQTIVKEHPDTTFLVLGKTHPGVVKSEGEKYRNMLEEKVKTLELGEHVQFVNRYLSLEDLLEYLQMTDIYLFTSKDPNQAVSGTFSYAMSCGCPIISTPIPHAREVLQDNMGFIVDFQNPAQLAEKVNRLLGDDEMRTAFSASALQRMVPTAWENSAIAHGLLFQNVVKRHHQNDPSKTKVGHQLHETMSTTEKLALHYRIPEINLDHFKKMTTDVGMIQFSKINQPDIESGYTLDDNARALIAMCMNYKLSRNKADLKYIATYLDFIKYCQQPEGNFLNYVDAERAFTPQNDETNLSDSNGRAIWALGYLISNSALLPQPLVAEAEEIIQRAMPHLEKMHSTRTMAFAIKGLYYASLAKPAAEQTALIKVFADRLVQMYRHEAEKDWKWFESYLTYANSVLPEAMLCAWLITKDPVYKEIAKASFDFLLSLTFNENGIKVISHNSWMQKGEQTEVPGEQPIDVAYTILALNKFYQVFQDADYSGKMATAFNWFLGQNHLHQIIYNPRTGGCYDGLEGTHVNLNQGAESTLSYLMARFTVEKQSIL